MSLLFLGIAVLAGVLTILAPCILPLLPIIIGSSNPGEKKNISKKSLVIIGSLALSVIMFTLLLKTTALFIDIPQSFWQWFSGTIIILVGVSLLFPRLWNKIPFIQKINTQGNKVIGSGHQKQSYKGDMMVGFALGPVFTTCSPTYLFIIATILPASFIVGIVYLIGFTLGLILSLLIVAYFGQQITNKIGAGNGRIADLIKKGFALLIIIVGVAIVTGYDKKLETAILDSGYGATIELEERLIKKATEKSDNEKEVVAISRQLKNSFSETNWNNVDPRISELVSGGPGKDGIPAIDDPVFELISQFKGNDSIQAIVLKDGQQAKVYPYNILTWHEIVNDTVDSAPVAVTFCPLCGSAIVFERTVNDKETTFGVSGFLRESNMVMYDRATESLWQQSTGEALAGDYLGTELSHVPFQLLTIGEVKELYPEALVLSENTGHQRDYRTNPYAGYEGSDEFVFGPSRESLQYPAKDIFVVFKDKGTFYGIPWKEIENNTLSEVQIGDMLLRVEKQNGELYITNTSNQTIPFYFEMWFSFFTQHGEEGFVINLK